MVKLQQLQDNRQGTLRLSFSLRNKKAKSYICDNHIVLELELDSVQIRYNQHDFITLIKSSVDQVF